jgi:hypothetical protein
MAASNYAPAAGNIEVISGPNDNVKKIPIIATAQRSFPVGTPLWLSTSGNAEPSLMPIAIAVGSASTYTDVITLRAAFAPIFLGFSAENRIPQQFADGSNKFSAAGPAPTALQWNDASRPFISVWDKGVAQAQINQGGGRTVTTQLEVGQMVSLMTFQNEASSGVYCPDGTLQTDTKFYAYMNEVEITTVTAHAIGVICERAPVGATKVKFTFNARVTNRALVA